MSEDKLCVLCGEETTFACSLCMETFYCGENCQRVHWEQGHMDNCGKSAGGVPPAAASSALGSVDDGKGSQLGAIPRAPQFLLARRDDFRFEGIAALSRGDWSGATTASTHAYRLANTFYGESHPDMMVECLLLACSHTQADHYQHSEKMAEDYLQEAISLCSLSPYEDGGINAVAFSVLGEVAGMMAESSLAVQLFSSYIAMLSAHFGPKHLVLSDGLLHLSRLHCGLGRFEDGLDAAHRSHVIRVGVLGTDHAAVADSRYNIAVVHLLLGSPHDAQREFVAALDAHVSPNTTQAANLRYGLAMAEHQIGSYKAAHSNYLAARRIREGLHGKDHALVAEVDACLNALNVDSDSRIAG